MKSLIVATATRFLLPLILLFSLFLLLRGHNLPGGGFTGGLVVGAAAALYGLAYGGSAVARTLGIHPQLLIAAGLGAAAFGGVLPVFEGKPFLTGMWTYVDLPVIGRLDVGTPLLFDIGVYLTVMGVVLTMLITLAED